MEEINLSKNLKKSILDEINITYENDINGIYESINEKNEIIEKNDIILCPSLRKDDGDIISNNVCNFLNSQINETTGIK